MKLNRRQLFVVFLVSAGAAIFSSTLWNRYNPGSSGTESPPSAAIAPTETPAPVTSASPLPKAMAASGTPNSIVFPSAETLRKEAGDDPHSTPASLIRFSQELSTAIDAAMLSGTAAERFFTQMEKQCLSPSASIAVPAQTLCLSAAEDLSKKYPDILHARYEQVLTTAPPEAKKLMEGLRKLGQ
jgi:hypothetical protein